MASATAKGDRTINMKVELQHSRGIIFNHSFKSQIKTQEDLDAMDVNSAEPSTTKISRRGTRKQNSKITTSIADSNRFGKRSKTFDIQVRNYKYKGVPDPSDIQLHKTAVGLVKKARDKIKRTKQERGC